MKTFILGPGAIGGYIGAHVHAAGLQPVFVGRPARIAQMRANGLRTSGGIDLPGDSLNLSDDPASLAGADRVLLTIKATALPNVLADLQAYLRPGTQVFCLLNGVSPARMLAESLPDCAVTPGMVPFNVMARADGTLHRSSTGSIVMADCAAARALASDLAETACPVDLSDDILAVQWGKLLLNLNNPVNALSGLALKAQLRDRDFRAVYAAALEEALAVYDASQTRFEEAATLPAARIVKILRWPNLLFNLLALPRQGLDEDSQTSMAQDIAAGRTTEIDTLNAEIVALGAAHDYPTPVNAALVKLVKEAETGGRRRWSGPALRTATGA